MTTPEAGRVEEIATQIVVEWAGPDGVRDHPILWGIIKAALTTQAETIRRLEERVTALVNADCAHDDLRETIRRLEDEKRLLLDTIARREKDIDAMNQRAERLEGEVARLQRLVTPADWVDYYRMKQRAEAAEGRVRELTKLLSDARRWVAYCDRIQREMHGHSMLPAIDEALTPSPATGEGA